MLTKGMDALAKFGVSSKSVEKRIENDNNNESEDGESVYGRACLWVCLNVNQSECESVWVRVGLRVSEPESAEVWLGRSMSMSVSESDYE